MHPGQAALPSSKARCGLRAFIWPYAADLVRIEGSNENERDKRRCLAVNRHAKFNNNLGMPQHAKL